MTDTQKETLRIVFNSLTDEQQNLDLLHLPYDKFEKFLNDKEAITVKISDAIENRSMFTGYSGVISLLRVSKSEVILKPNIIKELLIDRP